MNYFESSKKRNADKVRTGTSRQLMKLTAQLAKRTLHWQQQGAV